MAQTLNGDLGAALTTLDASVDAESAIGYYLKAIIGARQNNLDLVINNLKSATAKDAGLKAKAGKDREFIKFFENASKSSLNAYMVYHLTATGTIITWSHRTVVRV